HLPANLLQAAGVPRLLAFTLVFVAIIIILAGLVLLIVPLGVSEVGQLQLQAPTLPTAAQKSLNGLQPIHVFGIDIDLKGVTATINSHLREYLLGQFGNA